MTISCLCKTCGIRHFKSTSLNFKQHRLEYSFQVQVQDIIITTDGEIEFTRNCHLLLLLLD
jgi:hypothetical protein